MRIESQTSCLPSLVFATHGTPLCFNGAYFPTERDRSLIQEKNGPRRHIGEQAEMSLPLEAEAHLPGDSRKSQ